jgi:hypothetical protein
VARHHHNNFRCHRPALDRAIQYAAAYRLKHNGLWNTGSPAFAGDDSEYVVIAGLDPAIHL